MTLLSGVSGRRVSKRPKRRRGIILSPEGWQRLLAAQQQSERENNYSNPYSVEALAERTGLSDNTLSKIRLRQKPVDRRSLEIYFEAFGLTFGQADYITPSSNSTPTPQAEAPVSSPPIPQALTQIPASHTDWGEAIDVSVFHGRAEELQTLEQWILQDRCRLISILGMGGIGKTALSVKLAEQVQDDFEFLIWRSLRNAPTRQTLFEDIIPFLSRQEETRTDDRQLLKILKEHRCLVILDNLETLLQSGKAGQLQDGYLDYGDLMRVMGESAHQSCVILTSREKLADIAMFEGTQLAVRSLSLDGSVEASLALLDAKDLIGTELQKQALCQHYGGSPLALKIVASSIQDLFGGDIAAFLSEGTYFFNGVRRLLDQQFARLSDLEQSIMYWLAINRDWTTIADLATDILDPLPKPSLLESLEALLWRSLIEKQSGRYTQQSVVMEYVTSRFIETIVSELVAQDLCLFASHALLKTTVKDYVKQSQIRLIVQPILTQLFSGEIAERVAMNRKCQTLLKQVKETPSLSESYATGNLLNLCHQGQVDLTRYDFSELKICQADLQDMTLHQVSFAHADLNTSLFSELLGDILSIQFSPDGQLLATGDSNGALCLWDVKSSQRLQTFKGHAGWVLSVAYCPNGKFLATSSNDQAVRIWEIETGQCLHMLTEHSNIVWSVDFSVDGEYLASGSLDGRLKIWHVESGKCLQTLQEDLEHGLYCVAFHPSGKWIASGGDDHNIRIWELASEQVIQTFTGHTDIVRVIDFSADGECLASGSQDQTVRLWESATGALKATFDDHHLWIWTVAFHPSKPLLTSGGLDGLIKVWNTQTLTCERSLQAHQSSLYSLAFSPTDDIVISGGADQTVKFWQLSSSHLLKTIQGHHQQEHQIRSLNISPDGRQLITSGNTHVIQLWDFETGHPMQQLDGHQDWVFAVRFSADGSRLASAGRDQLVKLWDAYTGNVTHDFQGHQGWVFDIAFSPPPAQDSIDSELLASSSLDGTIKLWDLLTLRCVATLEGHVNSVWSIAFNPDGALLASGGQDHQVKLWDVHSHQLLATYHEHTNQVQTVAFSPQDKLLASGSQDAQICLFNIDSHKLITTLEGHGMCQIWDIAFSPDGQLIASGSVDADIRLWDVKQGKLLKTLSGHQGWILSVNFQIDGRTLVSGSADGSVKIWDVATGRCVKTLRRDRPYEGMDITGATGITPAQKTTLMALGAIDRTYPS